MLHTEQQKDLKKMSPSAKLGAVAGLRRAAWRLKAAGIRLGHPDWSEDHVEQVVREIFLHARS